jgi:hypothetical protein
MWDLKEGIKLIREIEEIMSQFQYHCALTGSVLYKGKSGKDLDVILYPHSTDKTLKEKALLKILESIKFTIIEDRTETHSRYGDDKIVYRTEYDGKRVDIFIMK